MRGGPLYAALLGSRSREIIERIVQNVGEVGLSMIPAVIQKGRLDVLQSLLRQVGCRTVIKLEQLVQCAKEMESQEALKIFRNSLYIGLKRGLGRKGSTGNVLQ